MRTDERFVIANQPPTVLASSSPRRRELLARLGVQFEVAVSGADENIFIAKTPDEMVVELALRKAAAVANLKSAGLVLGADTTVVLGGECLGKPADAAEAVSHLKRLRGRTHQVFTGVALIDAGAGSHVFRSVRSDVAFRLLSDSEIAYYVATGEPMDKAGAYGIQGLGRNVIEAVEGCFNNVIGLPLCAVLELFARLDPRISFGPATCQLENGELCPQIPEMERARWG